MMTRAGRGQPVGPPRRRGLVMLLLIATVVASSAAIAHAWTNLRAIDYGYQISRATRQRARLLQTNSRLRVELALLKRPERVARLANEAKLVSPEPHQVRRLHLPAQADPTAPKAPDRRAAPTGLARASTHGSHRGDR